MVGGSGGNGRNLWEMADLATPMALRVAATLHVADNIASGLRSGMELAEAANADADALGRILRHLAAAGVLSCDDSGLYSLTPLGEALKDDHPASVRAALDIEGAIGHADLAFVGLLHSARTGEPAFPLQFGRSFWEDLATNPARSASFDAQMGSDVAADASDIVSAYDWGSLDRVVDVGGGDGTLLAALLAAYPGLRGSVVDLTGAAAAARERFFATGLSLRGTAVAGSFFDPLPPGAGGYLLSAILHDWDDERARAILLRCADAAGDGGAVFVIEKIGADGESLRSEMDLRMLVYFRGRERDVAELGRLAAGCGLDLVELHPAGALSILELRRSSA